MAESKQQPEKKKARLAWKIFRWIGLGLLVLWLIAAIIFQASWKLITLLTVILAVCIILPKPARKWFWFSAGVVVIALIIWVFLPENDEGWRPFTFEKELAELEAEYAIPDEQNAALAYDEISENLDIDANQPEFFITSKPSAKDEPWLSKDHPQTAEWLKGHQNTIEKLLQAAKKDKCIFLPISVDTWELGEYMQRLPEMRQCAFLLVSSANNDMAEGRIDAGIEKYLCIIQMARHLYQQPVIIQHLVGFAIERMALEQLNWFVIEGRPGEQQLQLLSSSLISAEDNWGSNLCKILHFEKISAKNLLCSMTYEINPEGKIRLTRDLVARWRKQYPQDFPPLTYSQRKLNKARTIFFWLSYSLSPEKISEIVDASFEKCYAMAEPDFDWDKEPGELKIIWKAVYRMIIDFLTTLQCSSYYEIHESYLKNLAFRRGSQLLIAIKQYNNENGTWPDSLDSIKPIVPPEALIDPVTVNKFEYENHGKRFSLFGELVNIWPK